MFLFQLLGAISLIFVPERISSLPRRTTSSPARRSPKTSMTSPLTSPHRTSTHSATPLRTLTTHAAKNSSWMAARSRNRVPDGRRWCRARLLATQPGVTSRTAPDWRRIWFCSLSNRSSTSSRRRHLSRQPLRGRSACHTQRLFPSVVSLSASNCINRHAPQRIITPRKQLKMSRRRAPSRRARGPVRR